MKIKIESTGQLKTLFPYLSRTDKFKRCIDKWFTALKPELYIEFAEPTRCFKSETGKGYRAKITGYGKMIRIIGTRLEKSFASREEIESNPDKYRNVDYSRRSGAHWVNGVELPPHFYCEYDRDDKTSWGYLALAFGKFLKQEATVYTEDCSKCGGTGFIPQFAWYADGVCFDCMGIGKFLRINNENQVTN